MNTPPPDPDKPPVPPTWQQPPDPSWPPPPGPGSKTPSGLKIFLWVLAAMVGVPLAGLLLLFGMCMVGGR